MRADALSLIVGRRPAGSPRQGPCGALLIVMLITGLALPACERSSPTAPTAPEPATASVVFVDDKLTEHHETIRSLIATTVERANAALDVDHLRFAVSGEVARSIPGWGLGGYALGPNEIDIVVDPSFGNLASILELRLPQIVAHEIHHTVRWRSPGPYGTLLDAFVFEGLADHFAIELVGAEVPPWSSALSPDEIDRYLAQASPEFDNPSFDFNAWFFGSRDLPHWTGYALGFHLVGVYLARHPGRSAADLVHEPSSSFRPD